VPVKVVVFLEMIHVYHGQMEFITLAPGAITFFFEFFFKIATIVNFCQGVVNG